MNLRAKFNRLYLPVPMVKFKIRLMSSIQYVQSKNLYDPMNFSKIIIIGVKFILS
jgi:hypothetical protein